MGLIIKDKLRMLMKGYPTVSDKYNVAGGVLTGSTAVKFGELVKFSSTKGYFEAITSAVTLADIAGFVLATNVKLNELWPEGNVQVNPGEALNLVLPNSFLAVELDSSADPDYILSNSPVEVILANGKLTTSDQASTGTIEALPNVVFTGVYENQGTVAAPKYVAEVFVK